MAPRRVEQRARRLAGWAIASAACCRLMVGCLSIEESQPATDGGAGVGGSGLADSPWGTGGGSEAGVGGASGASGSGGFVAAACDTCAGKGKCQCVPSAPSGWSYVRLADGKQAKCSQTGVSPLLVGSGAVDTGCSSCKCGAVSGGTCGVRLWRDATYNYCAYLTSGIVYKTPGQCVTVSGSGSSMRLSPSLTGGTCPSGTAQVKPPEFAQPTTLCTTDSGGECGVGGACIPQAASPFETTACVMFDSQGVDVQCPAGYPNKQPYSTDFDDTRQCQCPCKVGNPCSGGVAHYGCDGGTGNDMGVCTPFQAGDFEVVTLPTKSSTGGCSPDGVATVSAGKLAAAGLRVVCCR